MSALAAPGDLLLARAIAARIRSHVVLSFIGEAELQAAVAKALNAAPYTSLAEVVLSPEDRIDFLAESYLRQRGIALPEAPSAEELAS